MNTTATVATQSARTADRIAVACCTAYLLAGFSMVNGATTAFQDNNGHTGVVERLAEIAAQIEDWLLTPEAERITAEGMPGVFYYEIVEPLGKWIHEAAEFGAGKVMAEFRRLFLTWVGFEEPVEAVAA